MRQREQRLWDAMRKAAPRGAWLQRIENVVGDGMPDVFVCGAGGGCCWVELKAPVRPARLSTPLLGSAQLRRSQINWLAKAAALRLRAHVLIRDDKRTLYLVPAACAETLNGMPLDAVAQASMACDWRNIYRELLR